MTAGWQAPRVLVREERGWHLSISRSGVGFRRFSQRYEDVVAAGAVPLLPDRAGRDWRRWIAPFALACGSLTAGVLAAPMRSGMGYSLVMPVPAAPARTALAVPVSRPAMGFGLHAPRHRAPVAAPARAATVDVAERRFTDLAMRTGAMQEWEAGGVRYFLVAGDLDAQACRQFSLLARPDAGADSVRQFERCRAGG